MTPCYLAVMTPSKEYLILRDRSTYPDDMQTRVNELARQGWEVVGFGLTPTDLSGHMQREVVLSLQVADPS